MSHVATVELHITSLDDLKAACERLGLEFVAGQTEYNWYGTSVGDYPLPEGFAVEDLGKCEHAIRVRAADAEKCREQYNHMPYEIGVVKRRDGKPGYSLLWDFYCGGFGLQDFVGEGCNKLKQAYAIAAATRAARQQGFRVTETQGQDGKVRLQCVR